jgi:hypothetical protein
MDVDGVKQAGRIDPNILDRTQNSVQNLLRNEQVLLGGDKNKD